ncbi:MAG TPA: DUF3185 family protein [Roseococcus sp.]|jgi:hypothetical protein|uniref:DUF3185 family protein n=1 Tax=Roseococcus thiosulfatophilus TaxID=35813 RepID=UPI001A8F316D|nr:DUF3185 family protein [Roseococcus thiosulfatophilus]HEV7458118.1 DUF3185 family protein [Roseococcus sp.]
MRASFLLGAGLAVLGVVLFIIGLNATQAPMEQVVETFTGRFTDQTMWYMIAGGVVFLGGCVLAARGAR